MIKRHARGRSGITLTEILISIMIMGIGLISLATLFPLGLIRIRAAARDRRSALLMESAESDISARNLLLNESFQTTWYFGAFDPYIQDPFDPATPAANATGLNLAGNFGPGLPVCYDPLWRAMTGNPPRTPVTQTQPELRFANGIGFLRPDPDGNGNPSGYGLQRLTNFGPLPQARYLSLAGSIFASQDDIVLQQDTGTVIPSSGTGSPVVPDMSSLQPMNDWTYTWLFTGRQTDVTNGTNYEGDVVVFQNRPFGVDQFTTPYGPGTALVASGETVVEAVWGYSSAVIPFVINYPGGPKTYYYPNGDDRVVMLRWPASVADPDIRVDSWIADVTYERFGALDLNPATPGRYYGQLYPGQRCIWYRVAKKGAIEVQPDSYANDGTQYRRIFLTLTSPVKAKTMLIPSGTALGGYEPAHVSAALVCPFVVNVFPKVFFSY
jgi:hypothetical protein